MNDTNPKQCAQCSQPSSNLTVMRNLDYDLVALCSMCREYVRQEQLAAAYSLYGDIRTMSR